MFRWLRMLEDFLFPEPPYCPFCGEAPLEELECCRRCAAQLALDWRLQSLHGRPAASLFPYQGYVRQLIRQMKYHGAYRIGLALGALLGRALQETPELAPVNLLVPVPLHPARRRQRGFNQAEALVQGIRTHWQRPVFTGVMRLKDSPSQSGLALEERRANVRHAFAVTADANLKEKTCLIVDDVVTSGSAVLAVARTLEDLGARCAVVSAARAVLEKNAGNPKDSCGRCRHW